MISDDEEISNRDPAVKRLVEKLVSKQVDAELKRRSMTDAREDLRNKGTTGFNLINSPQQTKFKSPSDSTLYTPAVGRAKGGTEYIPITEAWVKQNRKADERLDDIRVFQNETPKIDQVSEYIKDIRFNSDKRGEPRPSTSDGDRQKKMDESDLVKQQHRARTAAETAILDAERFKAQIQQPSRGMQINHNNPSPLSRDENYNLRYLRYLEQEDDEFFHTTCHIDQALREKISKGSFVELDKLIQKKTMLEPNNENRLQLVNKEGMSYFVPHVDRESKIDNIKKWEQAFRVYTTIYCEANPTRAGEILQYVDVIHRAAAIFNWENVARYDYIFRQLMASKPYRSWAKVYTQMWNLTLNEPIKKFHESGNHHSQVGKPKRKDTVCWKYNKGSCSYGKNCKFEHKCSYCGAFGHGVSNCLKKQNKNKDKNKNANSN